MADWLLENSGSLALASSATAWTTVSGDLHSATSPEGKAQSIARASYTLGNLLVYVLSNTTSGTITVRTRKNTANGACSISFSSSATGLFEDVVNTDSLASGDLFNYAIVTPASTTCTINKISCTLNDAGTSPPQIAGDPNVAAQNINTTRYFPLEGVLFMTATEANAQDRYTTQATISRLRIWVSFNQITTTNSTLRLRVNGAPGNNTVSVTFSTTGTFEDVTNTDTLSASDLVCVQHVTPNTTNTIFITQVQALTVAAGRRMQSNFTRSAVTQGFGVTAPYHLEGGTATVTEANAQLKTRIAAVFKNLYFRTPTNTVNGTSTCTLRVGGVDSALTVSIGSSATGAFEDTTHSVTVTSTDLVNWQLVTGGSSGTMTLDTIAAEQTTGGGTLYNQACSAVSASIATVTKGAGKPLAVVSASIATISSKGVTRTLSVISASIATVNKAPTHALAVISASIATVLKSPGKPLAVISASIATMGPRALARTLAPISATIATMGVRALTRTFLVVSPSIATVTKVPARTLATISASIATVTKSQLYFRTLSTISASIATLASKAVGRTLSVVSASVATVTKTQALARTLAAVSASIATISSRSLTRILVATVAASATITRSSTRILVAVSASIATIASGAINHTYTQALSAISAAIATMARVATAAPEASKSGFSWDIARWALSDEETELRKRLGQEDPRDY